MGAMARQLNTLLRLHKVCMSCVTLHTSATASSSQSGQRHTRGSGKERAPQLALMRDKIRQIYDPHTLEDKGISTYSYLHGICVGPY